MQLASGKGGATATLSSLTPADSPKVADYIAALQKIGLPAAHAVPTAEGNLNIFVARSNGGWAYAGLFDVYTAQMHWAKKG